MANLKSSKKDLRRSAKRRERNMGARTALKTHVKKVRTAATAPRAAANEVREVLANAVSALDKAAQRGIIHKNQAARRKSRIARAANKALAAGK